MFHIHILGPYLELCQRLRGYLTGAREKTEVRRTALL